MVNESLRSYGTIAQANTVNNFAKMRLMSIKYQTIPSHIKELPNHGIGRS